MFSKECQWIQNGIESLKIDTPASVLDIGCSSDVYRKIKQPYLGGLYIWMESSKNLRIATLDIDPLAQATYTVDISTDDFPNIGKFNIVLACSILEHIPREKLPNAIDNIKALTKNYLVVTSPLYYAWHFHPIDNGWRPTPEEIVNAFKNNFHVIKAESWEDEHYIEPYKSMLHYAKPWVSGVIFEAAG